MVYNIISESGITSKLEHIKEIGAGGIWLSPIFKSPMYDFGYDIADFYAIHDEFGTMEDFDELLNKANELGKLLYIFYIFLRQVSRILGNFNKNYRTF